MTKKPNFDVYLEEQMKDPAFAERFRRAEARASVTVAMEVLAMPILELTDDQVVDLVRQLPPERQRAALLALAAGAADRRAELIQYAEKQLRGICAERGLDWDKMSENEHEGFIDDLMHEDRPCGR